MRSMRRAPFYVTLFAGGFVLANIALTLVVPTNIASAAPTVSNVIYLTSGTTWTVPSDWTSGNNTIEVIGAGGGGAGGSSTNGGGGSGGGGGGYAKATNVTLTPSASVTYAMGTAGAAGVGGSSATAGGAGGDTYFCNSTSNCASISGTAVKVGAKGGGGGSVVSSHGTFTAVSGGAASAAKGGSGGGVTNPGGSYAYSGGASNASGASGGGGAAGPNGAGAVGGAGSDKTGGGGGGSGGNGATGGNAGGAATNSTGGAGGNNSLGAGGGAVDTAGSVGGGGGGSNNDAMGGAGGAGIEWDSSYTPRGSGGGGGGGGGSDDNSGNHNAYDGGTGGLYGGGGGGGGIDSYQSCSGSGQGMTCSTRYVGSNGATGAQGVIVITYGSTALTVSVSAPQYSGNACVGAPGAFSIYRNGPASYSSPVTVNLSWSGSAVQGVDYSGTLPTSVTIPANATAVSIPITPLNKTSGTNTSLTATITSSSNYNIGTASANMTINNAATTVETNPGGYVPSTSATTYGLPVIDGPLSGNSGNSASSVTSYNQPLQPWPLLDMAGTVLSSTPSQWYAGTPSPLTCGQTANSSCMYITSAASGARTELVVATPQFSSGSLPAQSAAVDTVNYPKTNPCGQSVTHWAYTQSAATLLVPQYTPVQVVYACQPSQEYMWKTYRNYGLGYTASALEQRIFRFANSATLNGTASALNGTTTPIISSNQTFTLQCGGYKQEEGTVPTVRPAWPQSELSAAGDGSWGGWAGYIENGVALITGVDDFNTQSDPPGIGNNTHGFAEYQPDNLPVGVGLPAYYNRGTSEACFSVSCYWPWTWAYYGASTPGYYQPAATVTVNVCPNNNQIVSGGVCTTCPANQYRSGNTCIANPPPTATIDAGAGNGVAKTVTVGTPVTVTATFSSGVGSPVAKTIYITSNTGTCGANCWTVPSDFNSANNTIEVIGGGGGAGKSTHSIWAAGGGGGGYAKATNVVLTPGASVTYAVGLGGAGGASNSTAGTTGGDTYLCNSSSNCASIAGTAVMAGAKGGTGGGFGLKPVSGVGGAAASAVGGVGGHVNGPGTPTFAYSGGVGGTGVTNSAASSAGGGAAGPNGAGANGGLGIASAGATGGGGGGGNGGGTAGNSSTATAGAVGGNNLSGSGHGNSNGGAGSNGGGGGGGNAGAAATAGGAGGAGTEWNGTACTAAGLTNCGSGGGGGSAGASTATATGATGGAGGLYGGGGGAEGDGTSATGVAGAGAQGIIVITYTTGDPLTATAINDDATGITVPCANVTPLNNPGCETIPDASKTYTFTPAVPTASGQPFIFSAQAKTSLYSTYNGYATVQLTVSCPANSTQSGTSCVCNAHYTQQGNSCVLDECTNNASFPGIQASVPTNATQSNDGTYTCSCNSPYVVSGGVCVPPGPPANLVLTASPARVKNNKNTQITWTGSNIPSQCTLTSSPTITGLPMTVSSTLTGNSTGVSIGPVVSNTLVTLTCSSSSGSGSAQKIVGTVPIYQEI